MTFRRLKKYIFRKGIPISGEIEPDQIFLDSSNLPKFDTHQFEGRLERPIGRGTFLLLSVSFILVGFIFVGRLFFLQVKNGEAYEIRSANNHLEHTTIFANRGIIYDRKGDPIAWNDLNPGGDYGKRVYSAKQGLSHISGYVKYPAKDKQGIYYEHTFTPKGGVEEFFNNDLAGENGLKITETDAIGTIQSESVLTPPKDGKNIYLSIDAALTERLHQAIRDTAFERGFVGGAGVIMDIHTGEVVALSSYPEFDANIMTEATDKAKIGALLSDKGNAFLNRAIGGQFIPGSIMKPFIALGVLEEGVIDPRKEIQSTGSIVIPNPYDPTKKTIFKDWKAHGWTDLRRALAVSSNVYFFSVGAGYDGQKGIGISNIEKYTKLFGFGSYTGIQLSGEKDGNVPSPIWKKENFEDGEWRLGDTYNSSIGQYGFSVTPLQAVRAVGSLVNGGMLITPTLIANTKGEVSRLPFQEKNFQIIREGMRMAVVEGTAKGLSMPGISVAAKTGTAELGGAKELVNSWVMGYFPYESPRYAFTVLMERGPYSNQIGATFAMRQVFEWMYINTPEYVQE